MQRLLLALALVVGLTSCVRPAAKYPAPADAARAYKATVEIVVRTPLGGIRGTGWFLEDGVVVTAGHVCLPGAMSVTLYDGSEHVAKIEYVSPISDVCVLSTTADAPEHFSLARQRAADMVFGTPVWYVGYPSGVLALGEGRVSGLTKDGNLAVSVPGWFGASGSALLDEHGDVVGVLSALGTGNGFVILFVPVEALDEALGAARDPALVQVSSFNSN